jgi:hypothetical protein
VSNNAHPQPAEAAGSNNAPRLAYAAFEISPHCHSGAAAKSSGDNDSAVGDWTLRWGWGWMSRMEASAGDDWGAASCLLFDTRVGAID